MKHAELLLFAVVGSTPVLSSQDVSREVPAASRQTAQVRSLSGVFDVHNLGLEASLSVLDQGVLAFAVSELGADVDGNGASDDRVVFVDELDAFIASSPTPRGHLGAGVLHLDNRRLLWADPEDGVDGNGDGDGTDHVAVFYDVATASLVPLGLAVERSGLSFFVNYGYQLDVGGDTLYVGVSEQSQGNQDLNGNGETDDSVTQILQVGSRNPLRPLQGGMAPAPLSLVRPRATSPSALGLTPQEEDYAVVPIDEAAEQVDLNEDGDMVDNVPRFYDWRTGAPIVLPYSGESFSANDEVLAFLVRELFQGGQDLNGDGDTLDFVPLVFERATGKHTLLDLGVVSLRVQGTRVLLLRQELADGDLNGDGDELDYVLSVYDVASATTTSTGLAVERADWSFAGAGDWVLAAVSELHQGNTDLNGDGDTLDHVLHRLDLASGTTLNLVTAVTSLSLAGDRLIAVEVSEPHQGGADFNLDGDGLDRVLGVFDTSLGTLASTVSAVDSLSPPRGSGNWLAFRVPERAQGNADANGDGDACDRVLSVYDADLSAVLPTGYAVQRFAVGDGVLAANVCERSHGNLDLNLDGDTEDAVLHVFQAR